jgi:HEAT repeat protein
MLEDNRKEVRLAAISAIAFMYDEREVRAPVPVVLRLARDEDPEVRVNAVDLLFALRPRPAEAAALVPELLRDKAPRVRRNTVCALMSVKDSERYLPDLSNLVNDEDVYTRGGLAYVLGSIGAPAVPLLARLLDDKIANVRGDAADSLGKIGPAAKDAAPSLKRLLTDMGRVHDLQGCVCNHAGEALAKILHDGKYLEGLPPMPRDGP